MSGRIPHLPHTNQGGDQHQLRQIALSVLIAALLGAIVLLLLAPRAAV